MGAGSGDAQASFEPHASILLMPDIPGMLLVCDGASVAFGRDV